MKRKIYLLKTVILCLLFLLVGKSALAQTELITNGGFETFGDGSWTVSTNGANQADSWWNVNNPSGAHSGSRYQYIGAKNDGVSAANNVDGLIYQTVTIPAGTTSATLSYYVRITTNESPIVAYDYLYVEIRSTSGGVLSTVNSYSNLGSTSFSSWTPQTVNLTGYAGQTIRVAFHGTTDSSIMTVFRIDDVSLRVTGTTATLPTVQTLAASSITTTSAQMNGSVNPNGSGTSAYFEYGTTTSYGNVIGSVSLGSGTSATAIQSNPTGLSPSTTYHYRTVATSSAGTNRGADVSFTTLTVTQQTGSLQVTIAPAGAVSAGAQWQVDGGAFQNSGATVSGLSVGSHTVAFSSISGWTTPGNHAVTVNANQTTTDSGTYQAASSVFTTSSPDYGVWNDNSGCLTSNDPSYNNKLAQLAQSIFNLSAVPTVGTGCITEPYLANGYSQYPFRLENHAGIDFRAPPGTAAYALYSGSVVNETLDIPNGHSTLVIESIVGGQTLRVFYLHCQSHNNELGLHLITGTSVSAGERVCLTGSVGAGTVINPAPHLHLEVKIKGMDGDNLLALFGSHCNPPNGNPFTAFDNSTQYGCTLGDIRARTVDPIILIAPASSITDPDITVLANTTQPVYWFYIAINNFSKWYIVQTTTSANPAVMFLYSANSSGLLWKPINNSAFNGFPSASTNFQSVTVSSDGRSIHFGALSGPVADPDITALANTTQPVYWFYIAINNFAKWYIVQTTTSANPAVMFLYSADSSGLLWKPINNSAFNGFSPASTNFQSVTVSSDGRSINFGGLSH